MAAVTVLTAGAPRVDAQSPDWTDVPALVASAVAPIEPELRACVRTPPRQLELMAFRSRSGTILVMPLPHGVGRRGIAPDDSCLMKATEKLRVPPLPEGIEQISLFHTIVAAGATPAAVDPAFDAWRDPAKTIEVLVDPARRAALAACDRKARTVRFVLDLRRGRTRIWLPVWQFHAPSGDGTTPPAQRKVKACLTKAIAGWTAPVLPREMPELQLGLAVSP